MTFEEYFAEAYPNLAPYLVIVTKAIAQHAWDAAKKTQGGCAEGEWCVCGGDLPSVREGCASWRSAT